MENNLNATVILERLVSRKKRFSKIILGRLGQNSIKLLLGGRGAL